MHSEKNNLRVKVMNCDEANELVVDGINGGDKEELSIDMGE